MSTKAKNTAKNAGVRVRQDLVSIPTYEPLAPDKHPMFLDKRVYQGSSGKVYPLPVCNRIDDKKTKRKWKAVHLENEFIKLMILPEVGGRIHVGQDKTNGYDFFYRQNVIKPALVGLTGPWASGGVEFNWPQHHRPATWMPVDVQVEESADGSKTVWFSDHDPMNRLKGMHGVCLRPGKAFVELKVRAYNRTSYVQTFLWWANVGIRVHEGYQSFFPTDVTHVADHAKRSTSAYPLCDDSYYGVKYGERAKTGIPESERPANFIPPYLNKKSKLPKYAANDLSWYANIPVPTSYMCVGSKEDFFGGYDHHEKAGIVHVANHHISPGKKQWTWGNQEFGYAWDRNLTDKDGPYIELMAGVYTDNQPDFSFLQPGETKTWSQYWYPIRDIGAAQKANTEAAIALRNENGKLRLGVSVTEEFPKARIELLKKGKVAQEWTKTIAPGKAFATTLPLDAKFEELELRVLTVDGRNLISYKPAKATTGEVPAPATEPLAPEKIKSQDELYVTGLHLDQYRHATRKPEAYWGEALRRDPLDSRCNNGMGMRCLKRGEFEKARAYFERAVERLTSRNPNPYDGEPYYNLGQALRFLGQDEEAYAAYYKATWNQAWASASYHAIAELDAKKGDWGQALDHLERSLRLNTDNLRARDLRAIALRKLGRTEEADRALSETLALDPLDWWARHLQGQTLTCDTQTRLDLAIDYARAGLYREAIEVVKTAQAEPYSGTEPLISYYLAWLYDLAGDKKKTLEAFKTAAGATSDYCFPARLEEIAILERAIARNADDAKAPYYLGNLLYDKERYEEGLRMWELSTERDAKFSIVWRNLGIAYFNVSKRTDKAVAAFEKAFQLNPRESRLLYERDQLWKRIGRDVQTRLKELEKHRSLVAERDDLAVELCSLYNQVGRAEDALAILNSRNFQPWEGGEGLALGQHVRTNLALGRKELAAGQFKKARKFFEAALKSPKNLGEAKHLLANESDIRFWLGEALAALGEAEQAKAQYEFAAAYEGDFQNMSVRRFSELTYYTARSLERLGKTQQAKKLFKDVLSYAKKLEKEPAKIDYFATSLPTLLLFEDDLQARQTTAARFMQSLAEAGLGQRAQARKLVTDALKRDPSHGAAADFARDLAAGPTKARSTRLVLASVKARALTGKAPRVAGPAKAISARKAKTKAPPLTNKRRGHSAQRVNA